MLAELAISTAMVLLTVVMHGGGLLLMARLLAAHERRRGGARVNPVSIEGAAIAILLALGLMVLHGFEIWLYAGLYLGIDAIGTLRDAVYFSTISYASIGYSDVVIAEEWRLLGGIEGVNGALLLGWSVAFFVTVMTRFLPTRPGRWKRPS